MTSPALAGTALAGTALTGTALTGTGTLARLDLHRDRIMLPVWVYLVVAGVASSAYSLRHLYPTAAARAAFATSGGGNPALRFLYGRLPAGAGGDSLGALSAWRYGVWAALFAALMGVFAVVRHTRADEEAGRAELTGSAAVGRLAGLTAALLVALAADLGVAVLMTVVLVALGLPAAGSAAFALAVAACGLAFAAVAAVTAQLAEGARTARGLAIGALGAAFLLRAAGDAAGPAGPAWLSWLSPLGWTELVSPYHAARWWVLALPLALTAAAVAAAYALIQHRDYGAGLVPARPGPPRAPGWLRGPAGLAWLLQRGTLGGWAAGVAVIFAVSGAAAPGIGSLVGGSTGLRQAFTRLGGQAGLTDAYLAAIMSLAGLAAAAYATTAVLRLRSEETEGRAEPVLATAAGRLRWAAGHLVIAGAGAAVLLAVAGLAAGLGYALASSGAGGSGPAGTGAGGSGSAGVGPAGVGTVVGQVLGAALVQLPAALAVAAVAVTGFGLVPRAAAATAWTVLALVVVIDLFGQPFQVSHWVLDVSPFTHVPKLPGPAPAMAPSAWLALAWLALAAAILVAAGLAGLRHRDIPA